MNQININGVFIRYEFIGNYYVIKNDKDSILVNNEYEIKKKNIEGVFIVDGLGETLSDSFGQSADVIKYLVLKINKTTEKNNFFTKYDKCYLILNLFKEYWHYGGWSRKDVDIKEAKRKIDFKLNQDTNKFIDSIVDMGLNKISPEIKMIDGEKLKLEEYND